MHMEWLIMSVDFLRILESHLLCTRLLQNYLRWSKYRLKSIHTILHNADYHQCTIHLDPILKNNSVDHKIYFLLISSFNMDRYTTNNSSEFTFYSLFLKILIVKFEQIAQESLLRTFVITF